MGMRTLPAAAAIAATVLLLASCSGGADDAGPDDGAASSECHAVDDALMAQIAEGANQIPIEPVAAAAAHTDDFPEPFGEAYIVAMRFTDDDGNDNVGTWAITGTLDEPELTMAVDPMAQLYTDWPGEIQGTPLDASQDGVDEAKACLEAG